MKELKFPYSGETVTINNEQKLFKQPDTNKVAVHPYGAIIGKIGEDLTGVSVVLEVSGEEYSASAEDIINAEAGANVEFNQGAGDNPAFVGTAIVDTSTIAPELN